MRRKLLTLDAVIAAALAVLVLIISPGLAVTGIIAAVAFLYLGLSVHKLLPIYGTVWLILLALGTRTLAFSTRTINGAAIQLHRELEEAAQVSGVRRSAAFLRLFLPLERDGHEHIHRTPGLLLIDERSIAFDEPGIFALFRRLNQECTGAITEQNAGGAIRIIDDAAHGVRADHEDFLVRPGSHQMR